MDLYVNTIYMQHTPVIAVIEDDKPIQLMYKTKLELAGFTVVTADDGEQGLEVIRKHSPALILLDIRMPVMNGDEMLVRLRETDANSHTRVIVLTNISRDEAPSNLRLLNVDRYLVKAHHTPTQVVETVQSVLRLDK